MVLEASIPAAGPPVPQGVQLGVGRGDTALCLLGPPAIRHLSPCSHPEITASRGCGAGEKGAELYL